MSVTLPFRLHRSAPPDEDRAAPAPEPAPAPNPEAPPEASQAAGPTSSVAVPPRPSRRPSASRPPDAAVGSVVRLGTVVLGSALPYLLLWTVVLFVVEVLVFWLAHTTLSMLGVLESVSRATATVLDDEVPASGVLPALEFGALLPWALTIAAALAALWLLTSLSLVLVHNCICALTGGPRLRVR